MKTCNILWLITISILFVNIRAQAQTIEWAKGIGGINYQAGQSLSVDSSGNIYISGTFYDGFDFNPGEGINYMTSNGVSDIYIAKFDEIGNFIWSISIGGSSWDESRSMTIDKQGNVYITGLFSEIADFDPSIDTAYLESFGERDIFYAKYDNNGNYLWAKNIGSYSTDFGESIVIDSSENVYIIGFFEDSADFDSGQGTAYLKTIGTQDVFFAKYSSNGDYIWAKNIGSTGYSLYNPDKLTTNFCFSLTR